MNAQSAVQEKDNEDKPAIGDLLQQRTEGKANFTWDAYRRWDVHVISVFLLPDG